MRKKEPEKNGAAANAIGLLEYWTGQELAAGESEDKQLVAWQKWFVEKFPAALEPKLPVVADNAKYTVDELVEYLAGEQADGVPTRGGEVFAGQWHGQVRWEFEGATSPGYDFSNNVRLE